MAKVHTYSKNEALTWSMPNYWDVISLVAIFGIIVLFIWGAKQMATPYDLGKVIPVSLDPKNLPLYAVRTVLRMFIALGFALLFTFIFGAWAGKSKRAARVIIPFIDIMQSLPVLGFISITVVAFIRLFKGSMLGPECAAIFAIFTSQVWNMALSFYQSVSTVPKELKEAAKVFKLSVWRCFWKVEVPFAMPALLWNIMMSMSGSWFFVVASEAISISSQSIALPGVGSYIALAITHADYMAIIYAIITMLVVILLYDQLLFRPLVKWSEKFKFEQALDVEPSNAWVVDFLQRAKLLKRIGLLFVSGFNAFVNIGFLNREPNYNLSSKLKQSARRSMMVLVDTLFILTIVAAVFIAGYFLFTEISFAELKHVMWLGLITGIRVMALIIICSLIWVPIGVWIGLRPKFSGIIQPIIQFCAAFPANLLYPIVALFIIKYKLNVDIWASPLAVLGTQWYILFNVIAGATMLPEELKQAAGTFRVKGWLWWKRLALPSVAPFFVTGAITAAGGAWNASILAEVVSWGNIKLQATGLGAYITYHSGLGDFTYIILGILVMSIYVLLINRLVWRPLYNFTIEKFRVD